MLDMYEIEQEVRRCSEVATRDFHLEALTLIQAIDDVHAILSRTLPLPL